MEELTFEKFLEKYGQEIDTNELEEMTEEATKDKCFIDLFLYLLEKCKEKNIYKILKKDKKDMTRAELNAAIAYKLLVFLEMYRTTKNKTSQDVSEDEIVNAGIEYQMSKCPTAIGGDNFYETARQMNRNCSFEDGAKWMLSRLRQETPKQ